MNIWLIVSGFLLGFCMVTTYKLINAKVKLFETEDDCRKKLNKLTCEYNEKVKEIEKLTCTCKDCKHSIKNHTVDPETKQVTEVVSCELVKGEDKTLKNLTPCNKFAIPWQPHIPNLPSFMRVV